MGNSRMRESSFEPDRMLRRPPGSQKQDMLSIRGDHRAQFYKKYRKEAEDYDKKFMKKHDEDLNTTLIFVGFD